MPLITVSYSTVRKSPSLKTEIATAVSDLTAKILRKDPKVTAIIVKSVDAADWFAGGQSLAEQNLASFWLDVHVSEGTNTKDEKAAISTSCSSAWANCSGRCTRKAMPMSTRSRATPTASAASPRSAATSQASWRWRRGRLRREDSLTCGRCLRRCPRMRFQQDTIGAWWSPNARPRPSDQSTGAFSVSTIITSSPENPALRPGPRSAETDFSSDRSCVPRETKSR